MKRTIAALAAVMLIAAYLPAEAGSRRGHGGGGVRYHGHGHGSSDGAWIFAAILGGLVVGHLIANAARPDYRPAPAYRPYYRPDPVNALRDCQPTTGQGMVDGRPAEFAGTICYDAYRRPYIIQGSERFIGFLQ